MPELVEVETTRRDLKKRIVGERIVNCKVFLDKIVYDKKDIFISEVINKRVQDVKRRGKWLLIELEEEYIVIHFRMEGRFYLLPLNTKNDKHDYVIFDFEHFSLHYNDPRQFGKIQIIDKKSINDFFEEKKLGLEYDDLRLTPKYLKEKFSGHNTAIKKLLLDQKYITGIGNIYADEILFRSKINPNKTASKLSIKKLKEIIDNTRFVFEEALLYKGTYPNIDGKRGTYELHLKVHMRENKKCYVCGSIIKKIKVGSRGTYYCQKCQKM